MPKFLDLFRKPVQSPLPKYPHIDIKDVPAASALVFYGSPGNPATEMVGSRLYHHKYTPPAFHAALYIEDGDFLNVGRFREIKSVEGQYKTTRRVDVIVYNLPSPIRRIVVTAGKNDITTSKKNKLTDYSIRDFLRFCIPFLKPSKKDFCSENVVENFLAGGFNPSELKPVDTAPWDLVEWAESHPELATIYTLHEGDEFKRKLGRS